MNRLARPWEALKLPLEHATEDTFVGSTGLVGEIIIGDIEMYANAVREAKQPNFDADRSDRQHLALHLALKRASSGA